MKEITCLRRINYFPFPIRCLYYLMELKEFLYV